MNKGGTKTRAHIRWLLYQRGYIGFLKIDAENTQPLTNASVKVWILTVKAVSSVRAAIIAVNQICAQTLSVVTKLGNGEATHAGCQILCVAGGNVVLEKIQHMRVMGVIEVFIELAQTQRPAIRQQKLFAQL
ncbi:hypothetical protein D8B25_14310 [Verminephrobacter aporrectodeae subsp. tuberculatae]|nr:hypothetical protein [Verminephrobacter aporrectodeae subsp. tuberculatae]MCW8204229.1 hypothetical protein [Verminephrobacter aporrectodeae subsp. tuberculatae]